MCLWMKKIGFAEWEGHVSQYHSSMTILDCIYHGIYYICNNLNWTLKKMTEKIISEQHINFVNAASNSHGIQAYRVFKFMVEIDHHFHGTWSLVCVVSLHGLFLAVLRYFTSDTKGLGVLNFVISLHALFLTIRRYSSSEPC